MSWNPETQPYKVDVYRKYEHPRDRWNALRVHFFATWQQAIEFANSLTGEDLVSFRISYALNKRNWIRQGGWLLVARKNFPGELKMEKNPDELQSHFD